MARRITTAQETTTVANTRKTENKSELFMNLGLQLKDGTFIRLSNSIVISADTLLTESKNTSRTSNEVWKQQQNLRNKVIKELTDIFSSIEKGETVNITDFDEADTQFIRKLTFQFHKVGDKPEVTEDSYATEADLDLLA